MGKVDTYKKYKSSTGVEYNFYAEVDGEEQFISMSNPGASLIVRDMKLAKAIENSNAFKSGKIYLEHTVGEIEDEDAEENTETKSYPDVKNMGDAVDVLMNEYGVSEADLALKKDVLAKAKELGVSFPKYR